MNKQVLRETYLHKRKQLSREVFSHRCKKILDIIRGEKLTEGSYVHLFLPIEKFSEIDTWPIVELLVQKKVNIVISKSDLSENTMTHFLYEDKSLLKKNKWGIPEPVSGQLVNPKMIDIVFVPLVVFDLQGHRIGYGKGYYDRFLGECTPEVKKIGLSITPALDFIPYTEPNDIQLDQCITHLGQINFNRNE